MLLTFQNLQLKCVRTMHYLYKIFSFTSCFFPRNSTKNIKCTFKLFLIYGCSSVFSSTIWRSSDSVLIGGFHIETFTSLLILKLYFLCKMLLYLNTSKHTCSSAVSSNLPSVSYIFPVFLGFWYKCTSYDC